MNMIKQQQKTTYYFQSLTMKASLMLISSLIFFNIDEEAQASETEQLNNQLEATPQLVDTINTTDTNHEAKTTAINNKNQTSESIKVKPPTIDDISDFEDITYSNNQISDNEKNITYANNNLNLTDADSSTKYSEYTDINESKNTEQDTTAPSILTATIDKSVYTPGETVHMSVRIKEENELSDVSVGFSNDTNVGIPYLSEVADLKNIYREKNDIWVVNISIPIPEKTGDTSFSFAALVVDDVAGNGDTLAPRLEQTIVDVSKLNFTVKNDVSKIQNIDTSLPKITKITTDKPQYHAGESILAHVFIQDDSELSEVSLGFVNKPYTGYDGFSQFAKPDNIIKIDNGLWRVDFNFKAPMVTTPSIFKFSHVSATDEFNNSLGIVDDLSISEITQFTNFSITVLPKEDEKNDIKNKTTHNQSQELIKPKYKDNNQIMQPNKPEKEHVTSEHAKVTENKVQPNKPEKEHVTPEQAKVTENKVQPNKPEKEHVTSEQAKVTENKVQPNNTQASELPNTGIKSQTNILLIILVLLTSGGYLLFKRQKTN